MTPTDHAAMADALRQQLADVTAERDLYSRRLDVLDARQQLYDESEQQLADAEAQRDESVKLLREIRDEAESRLCWRIDAFLAGLA